jgi:hypothetical protein
MKGLQRRECCSGLLPLNVGLREEGLKSLLNRSEFGLNRRTGGKVMNCRVIGFGTAIFLFVSAASSALAADEKPPGQTPEGAQAMLTLLAGQGTVKIDVDTGWGFNITSAAGFVEKWGTVKTSDFWNNPVYKQYSFPEPSTRNFELPSRSLLSSTANSVCKTELVFSDDESKRLSTLGKFSYQRWDGTKYEGEIGMTIRPQGYTAANLDWAKIAKVEALGSTVVISPLSPRIRLQLPSTDLANRVAFAMEFLRTHCDPLGKTGF